MLEGEVEWLTEWINSVNKMSYLINLIQVVFKPLLNNFWKIDLCHWSLYFMPRIVPGARREKVTYIMRPVVRILWNNYITLTSK